MGGAWGFYLLKNQNLVPTIIPVASTANNNKGTTTEGTNSNKKQATQPTTSQLQLNQPKKNLNNTLVDCGSTLTNPDNETKVKACIELNFKNCKPAKATISLGDVLTYYYEIIGPKNNYCLVKSKFLSNPNPEWVGKEMTCSYNNLKSFDTAIQDFIGKCSGPLYDLMTVGIQPQNNSVCTLETDATGLEVLKGISFSITASGFKGTENQISWVVKDENIATVSPSIGKVVMLKALNIGSTQVIFTDNFVGPNCFVSLSIIVHD